MDEQQCIRNILAGDTRSFSCLVMKYQQMAYTIAYRILMNREEAEETVQDSFVKAFRALPDFHFDSKFSTWFYKIVYRTALTAQKKQQSQVTYEDIRHDDVSMDEKENATSLLEQKDRKEIISKVLQLIPHEESVLLNLFYLEECSIEEIHQITDYSLSNIKVKLFRGRKHFYETLEKVMKQEKIDVL